jgi:hypothetical protein
MTINNLVVGVRGERLCELGTGHPGENIVPTWVSSNRFFPRCFESSFLGAVEGMEKHEFYVRE